MTETNRAEYLHERDVLLDLEKTAIGSLDTSLTLLSAGGCVLSLMYLRDQVVYILFGIALLSTVWSLLLSQIAIRWQRSIWDAEYEAHVNENMTKQSDVNYLVYPIVSLHWVSVITFTVGCIWLMMVVHWND